MEMERYPMNAQALIDTAKKMVASDKGLLAMDESNPTCKAKQKRWPLAEHARRSELRVYPNG